MKALITGASSGIGRQMARILSYRGYDLILVARNEEKLKALARVLPTRTQVICADLSDAKQCVGLFETLREEPIDILINNAGFGVYGPFEQSNLDNELNMIDVNIKAVHILTKLFLKKFIKQDSGYILNVSSAAAFYPGPLMASYYATKAYVLRMTVAIGEELRRRGSHVYIGSFCPGPIRTEFEQHAGVDFRSSHLTSIQAARIAIAGMFFRRKIILAGKGMKAFQLAARLAPQPLVARFCWHMQRKK